MIEKMEAKIDNHIEFILNKETIDYSDYQILSAEISRQIAKERDAKWEAERDQRNAAMLSAMQNAIFYGTK